MESTAQSTLEVVRNETNTILQDDMLAGVLMSFPAGLVACADGVLDETERHCILGMCHGICEDSAEGEDEFKHFFSVAECYSVFMHLLNNRTHNEELIFNGIKHEISEMPDSADVFRTMLNGMAEASDGVSEIEQKEINRICEALGI